MKDKIPVIDHMWQTETGGPIFGNPYGLGMLPIKPGSVTIPLPGIEAKVIGAEGQPCGPDEKGIMVIQRPFPGLTAALWGEPERYGKDYWERMPGVYYTGDSVYHLRCRYRTLCPSVLLEAGSPKPLSFANRGALTAG